MTSITPAASICAAAVMNGDGRSRPRDHTEPNAHAMGAMSSITSPDGDALMLLPALSHSTPRKPIAMPSHSPRVGWRPNIAPNSPIHSGIDATAMAARPDDTVRSASTTRPLPISTSEKAEPSIFSKPASVSVLPQLSIAQPGWSFTVAPLWLTPPLSWPSSR